ncbi:MOB kinase activator-like 2 isoform X2 [Bactrocera neohumeralis]|uniref:MOB kinase activator-like 2 isoform X2 n=1 Tax=Bactrocera neohumeralis TaxID=98809 RepID=UPI002166B2B1|nr:MOB kinase activator-like 2 isoform X2 [Bactrocera neohumeralis]
MSYASADSKTTDEIDTPRNNAADTATSRNTYTNFGNNSAAIHSTPTTTTTAAAHTTSTPSSTTTPATPNASIATQHTSHTHTYAVSAPADHSAATSATVTFNPEVTTFTARWTHNSSSESSSSSAKSSFSNSTYSSAHSAASAVISAEPATETAAPTTTTTNDAFTERSVFAAKASPPTARPPPRKRVATNKSPAHGPGSFVVKCLLKTVRFMWQVTEIPTKIGETIGSIYRYAQDSVETILCVAGKARRKERDGDQNSTDTKLYLEESVLERKLPEADLKALVDLPAGLDYNEWLASHTLALFEHVNLVYGTISEFCTPSGCADMTGPGNRTYLWFDEKGKKTRVAAPQYIDYVMTFTQKTVSDESIFPTKYANEFPSSFESIARKILRLQFHVIAHLYAAHFREIALLGLHTHLNLTFAHLTALHRRFTLIDEKETDVLRDLEVALRLTDDGQSSLASSTITATTDGGSSSCGGGGSGGGASSGTTADSGIANSGSSYSSGGGAAAHAHHSQQQQQAGADDVNLLQQQQSAGTTLIDGDAAAPPICTQPEAQTKQPNNAHASTAAAVFGGGGGLIGGILGDLSSGEFGETATRYCTSALPQHQQQAQNAEVAVNCNNGGAGALHLNFNNNHHHHHHHHHHQHAHAHQPAAHHHFTQQQQQHQQHSGLIQCNASNAPNANTVTNAAATTATNASAAATTTTA